MTDNTLHSKRYRGRIAPTPTGLLHLGHARTFWTAYERCSRAQGTLIFRNEDLDPQRCQAEFAAAAIEDLRWLGIQWHEGPDIGGLHAPYHQSQRMEHYLEAWKRLKDKGVIYPSKHSRKDLREAVTAPHEEDGELLFPTEWRTSIEEAQSFDEPGDWNWRFRVPNQQMIDFEDIRCGKQSYQAGIDFGDFLIWRRDNVPAYELAVVVDDIAMGITEIVRGEDLLKSTARQKLIYEALDALEKFPLHYHCPLIEDEKGQRLAKRHDAMSLHHLREQGVAPESIRI